MFFTRKDRKIANQKAMIENRDKLIKDMQEQAKALYEENKDLRYENEELTEFRNKIIKTINNSGTIVDKYDKINELISDDQSQN